jgi:hypothetical protein
MPHHKRTQRNQAKPTLTVSWVRRSIMFPEYSAKAWQILLTDQSKKTAPSPRSKDPHQVADR